ncbi:MAG TPA: hypothetical protein VFA77_10415 [Candidatus Eisenbacteria bacterium]|nr:hypothetical protein [Candidatus Eisenbacteria bacterium]
MKTKLFTFVALAILMFAGCTIYRGGTSDDYYTVSYGQLYGLNPGPPMNIPPNGSTSFPSVMNPVPYSAIVRP